MGTVAAIAVAAMGFAESVRGATPVFKCLGPGSSPVYQELACPGQELRNFASDPPTLSVVPGLEPSAAPVVARAERTVARRALPAPAHARTAAAQGDASARRYVHAGMSDAEIVAKLGRPQITARAGKGRTRWTYLPAAADPDTITTISLERGAVVEVERRVVK